MRQILFQRDRSPISSSTRRVSVSLVWMILVFIAAGAGSTRFAMGQTNRDVEEGSKALTKAARFPWYDRTEDEIKSVVLPKSQEPLKPSSTWKKKETLNNNRTNWNFSTFWELIEMVVWGLLIAFFVVVVALILRSFGFSLSLNRQDDEEEEDERTEEERIAQLPFPVKKAMGNLLTEAQRFFEKGDYAKAIIYLFSHQLVHLDKSHLIYLTRGKTNRQYLSELRSFPKIKQLITDTMLAFEDVFFGGYPLEKERFDQCWNRLDEFHDLVKTRSHS